MDKNLISTPFLSIVIPVYNRKHTLSRALESVFKQTFKDFEILVVNDGSTDDVENLLNLYSDPRLRILNHFQNKGASAARNTGIKAARGEFIAFLDSDDEWCLTKLEEQISSFEKEKKNNKNIKGSFTSFFLHKNNGFLEQRNFKNVKNWKKYFLEGCFISPGSTLLVDKKVYEIIGFYDESLERFEDWDWLLRFSEKFDLVTYGIPLSHIHQGERPSYKNVASSLQKMSQKHFKYLSGLKKMKFLSTCQIELFYSYKSHNLQKAFGFLIFSIMMNPLLLKKGVKLLLNKLQTLKFFKKK